jgi:RNA polymerase sigma factor (sigma-70 family)
VRAAVAQLPEDDRRVIELQVFAEMSHAEIATALGWTLDRVKNRARSAREKLLELLEGVDL